MKKYTHFSIISTLGLIWLTGSVLLMGMGVNFIIEATRDLDALNAFKGFSILKQLLPHIKNEKQAPTLMMSVAILIGYLKGRFFLAKTVKRTVKKVTSLPNPTEFKNAFSLSFILLISLMVLFSIIIKSLNIYIDVRGMLDLIIGSALLKGSLNYFKSAIEVKRGSLSKTS